MSEFQTVSIPVDLEARMQWLLQEYRTAYVASVEPKFRSVIDQYRQHIPSPVASMSIDFVSEYDDEDGYDWCLSHIYLRDANGDSIDIDDITINQKSKYIDTYYDYDLSELIRDNLNDLFDWDEFVDQVGNNVTVNLAQEA